MLSLQLDVGTASVIDSDDEGYYTAALERIETGTGYRYFEVKGKFTNYADGIIVGYGYDFEIELPKIYYRPETNETDFTATLTISRVKFLLAGQVPSDLKSRLMVLTNGSL